MRPMFLLPLALSFACSSSAKDGDDGGDEWGDEWGDDEEGGGGGGVTATPDADDGGAEDTGEGDGDEGDNGDTGEIDDTCGTPQLEVTTPETTSDVYYRTTISFTFSRDTDEDAIIDLMGPDGAHSGSQEWVGDTVIFSPNTPLDPNTDYVATLTHCGGEASTAFTTSDLGTPITEGTVELVGQTYALNLDDATFVRPAGVGSLILSLLDQTILFGITEVTTAELRMMSAVSEVDSWDQDFCSTTNDFPVAADFSSPPYFELSAGALAISFAGSIATINDFIFAGDFTSDGSRIGGAVLSGQLDARDLSTILSDGGLITDEDSDAVCSLFSAFGVSCDPCADGENYCISLLINDIYADETGSTLAVITDEEAEDCDG